MAASEAWPSELETTGTGRTYPKILFFIILVAVVVRVLWIVTQTAVIESEGAEYARIAQNLVAGRGYVGNMEGTELMFPPLYPILIAFMSFLTRDFEVAGRVVSLILGVLLVLPMYFIALRLYGRQIALVCAVLVCFHPLLVALSGSVYSEGSFLTLVMGGVYYGLEALRLERLKHCVFAGVLFGLAYLVRPEAIVNAILLGLAILVVAIVEKRSLRTAALAFATIVGSIALIAAPYIIFLSLHTGHFRIEGKKNINLIIAQRANKGQSYLQAAFGISPDLVEEGPLLDPNRFVDAPPSMTAKGAADYFLEAAKRNKGALYKDVFPSYGFGPILLGMVVLGLFARPWNRERLIFEGFLLLMLAFFLLLILSLHVFFYRYAFPLLPFLLLWAAKGIEEFSKWSVATGHLTRFRLLPEPARIGSVVRWGVSLSLLVLATAGLRDVGEFEQAKPSFKPVKQAGLWLREYGVGGKRIMNIDDTITFYAGGTELEFPYCDSSRALAYIHRKDPDFIVLNGFHGTRTRPFMEDWLKNGIPDRRAQLVYETGKNPDERIAIYRWTGEPAIENGPR